MSSDAFKPLAKDDLLSIAEYRNISATEAQPSKEIVKLISEDVSTAGLQILLEGLEKDLLNKLSNEWSLEFAEYGKGYKPSGRLIAKKLVALATESSSKDFFAQNEKHLAAMIDQLEIKNGGGKDKEKNIKALLAEADALGLENCFSAFSTDRLKDFAGNSKLKVYGGSREKILDALITRTNMDKPKEKPKQKAAKPSKNKPDKIAKGISGADLQQHYYLKELQEFCKAQSIPSNGSKKVLIKRILEHLEEPKKKKRAAEEKAEGESANKKTKTK